MVERGGLENRCAFRGTEGSNPSLSANIFLKPPFRNRKNPMKQYGSFDCLFVVALRTPPLIDIQSGVEGPAQGTGDRMVWTSRYGIFAQDGGRLPQEGGCLDEARDVLLALWPPYCGLAASRERC